MAIKRRRGWDEKRLIGLDVTVRWADDLIILVDEFRKHDWLKRAVEKLKAALLKDENFSAETTEPMEEASYVLNKEGHYEFDQKR